MLETSIKLNTIINELTKYGSFDDKYSVLLLMDSMENKLSDETIHSIYNTLNIKDDIFLDKQSTFEHRLFLRMLVVEVYNRRIQITERTTNPVDITKKRFEALCCNNRGILNQGKTTIHRTQSLPIQAKVEMTYVSMRNNNGFVSGKDFIRACKHRFHIEENSAKVYYSKLRKNFKDVGKRREGFASKNQPRGEQNDFK